MPVLSDNRTIFRLHLLMGHGSLGTDRHAVAAGDADLLSSGNQRGDGAFFLKFNDRGWADGQTGAIPNAFFAINVKQSHVLLLQSGFLG
jgi:hypothetical protein